MENIVDAIKHFQRRPLAPPPEGGWQEMGIKFGQNVEFNYIILDKEAQKALTAFAGGVIRDGIACLLADRKFGAQAKFNWDEKTGEVTVFQSKHHNKRASSETDAVIEERGKVYGEPELSHQNIGLEWTGMLQQHYQMRLDHPLPGWLVELMMGGFKLHRSCLLYHADNYTDFEAYVLKFAKEHQRRAFEKRTE